MDINTIWGDYVQPTLAVGWGLASPIIAAGAVWYGGPLIRRGIEAAERRLGIQVDQATNDAIQAAIQNYAGVTLGKVRAGQLSVADVRSGAVTRDFLAYMQSSVGDAIAHHAMPDARLVTMLAGKVENTLKGEDVPALGGIGQALIGSAPAAPVPVMAVGAAA